MLELVFADYHALFACGCQGAVGFFIIYKVPDLWKDGPSYSHSSGS